MTDYSYLSHGWTDKVISRTVKLTFIPVPTGFGPSEASKKDVYIFSSEKSLYAGRFAGYILERRRIFRNTMFFLTGTRNQEHAIKAREQELESWRARVREIELES